jgi:hypothetical protein
MRPTRNQRSQSSYYPPNIRPLPNLVQPQPWWKSKILVACLIVAAGILFVPWLKILLTSSVIHYAADDNSESAIGNLDLRKVHCQTANNEYKDGDIKNQISFAHKPEVVLQQEISNTLSLGKCSEFPGHSKEITRYPGTSLIVLLEYINTLIKSDRAKGKKLPIAVTITLQAAEDGPGLPKMNEFGFLKIQKLVEEIQRQHGVIAIVGPTGSLQQNLNTYLSNYSNVTICTATDIDKCISHTFSTARNLGSIQ